MNHSDEQIWPQPLRVGRRSTHDAVVVVPGIMGSALVDSATGKQLWGLKQLRWYVRAWSRGDGLADLAVSDDELAGDTRRVRPDGLLAFPAFAPFLAGLEPYTELVNAIRRVVSTRQAVLEFAYDWRLSVAHNAKLLAAAAGDHLEQWRKASGRADARLVFVAHSMGGLLCRALPTGLADEIRATITLGTPFDGAAKAALIINSGVGAPVPLPERKLQAVASTMPGVHDLLPAYRCVDEGDSARRLTPSDVAALGGSAELARQSFALHAAARPLIGHRALVGINQPTVCSLDVDAGIATGLEHSFEVTPDGELSRRPSGVLVRVPGLGDATVPRNSARPARADPLTLAQQHGPLASSIEARDFVCDALIDVLDKLGPRLGEEDGVGLRLPGTVDPNVEWTATLTGVVPTDTTCVLEDLETGAQTHLDASWRDGDVAVAVTLPAPGLYRLSVTSNAGGHVSQLVLATEPLDAS
ncbi:lipase/acyltransferase domain-containing protein [Actinosynnema sp. CA-299493]